jgi:hypothetical protein
MLYPPQQIQMEPSHLTNGAGVMERQMIPLRQLHTLTLRPELTQSA